MNLLLPLLLVLSAPDGALPEYTAGGAELSGYLQAATEHNRAIQAQHSAWLAALERVPQATALDDPMFTLGQYLSSTSLRTRLSLAQKFPWFGTRRQRGARAATQAEAMETELDDLRNEVVAGVKMAYFRYAYLHEEERVTQSQLDVLAYMSEVVRGRYALGLAVKGELLQIEIEEEQLQDRLQRIAAQRPVSAAALNAYLGAPTGEERPWPEESLVPVEPPAAPLAVAWIHKNNPALARLSFMEESQQQAVDLARRKGLPDITVGIDYTSVSQPRQIRPDRPYPASLHGLRRLVDTATGNSAIDPIANAIDLYAAGTADEPFSYRGSGDDNVMVSISMNVPIYRKKIRAGMEEARHEADRYARERENLALALERDARQALFEIADARRQRDLLEDSLMPKAKERFESLQSAYASGAMNSSLVDVLDSVRALLTFDLQLIQTLRDEQLAAARLEYILGGSWVVDSKEMEESGGNGDDPAVEEAEEASQAFEVSAERP